MKIGIPVNDNNKESGVCISFGRAPWFMVYDTEKKSEEFIKNTAADSPGGAGIKAAQILVDSKINALITPRCGENAAEVIKGAGIEIFKSQGENIGENIDQFEKNSLDLLDDIHPGFHGHES
ncbi:NifB/NifX family molybdenum-iron cluster-binding protein [Alkalibacter mobilis]|uniref:NifB/NifX family molybdenum-iron cluster-binding protein n=1 Tax=Alkalibacter mobilis TaxID=2787712 RepID=UPI00189FC64A|nr:NifB/NifX family molybdenum-iron cluster-binding protein [Alkalibacter mobilis]MBF7096199.1 NifB/NifX family molybdenum-iron cluster-binding protein [Alkalibacter mobilis]